jgi:hypothetical protein
MSGRSNWIAQLLQQIDGLSAVGVVNVDEDASPLRSTKRRRNSGASGPLKKRGWFDSQRRCVCNREATWFIATRKIAWMSSSRVSGRLL